MARYSLFVLKVPLNPKQTNKQTKQLSVKMFSIATMWLLIMFVNVWVGDISAGIKIEPDISECPHVDVPGTGMFVFHDEQILCTVFASMFQSSNSTRCHK